MDPQAVALVTGATRGIGQAIARELALTHRVIAIGRDRSALRALAEELPVIQPLAVDITDSAAIARACGDIDRLDVLVHSAGIAKVGPLARATAEIWRETLELNVIAIAELTRVLLPALRAANGHVVLINSGAGLRANPGWGVYAASKFALRAFADVLRAEEQAIRVTSIYPGRVDTAMQRSVRDQEGGAYEAEKYLRPQAVAQVVISAITAPADAHPTELTIRPRPMP